MKSGDLFSNCLRPAELYTEQELKKDRAKKNPKNFVILKFYVEDSKKEKARFCNRAF